MTTLTRATVGGKVTASITNGPIDLLTVRTAYTPTLVNFSSTGQVTSAYYTLSGNLCTVEVDITLGASGVSVAIPTMSLPFATSGTGKTAQRTPMPGMATYYDTSTTTLYNGMVMYASTTTVGFFKATSAVNPPVFTSIAATTPMTWAASDELHAVFSYIVA